MWILKEYLEYQAFGAYLTTILGMNVSPMQTWRIVHDLGIVSKRPKLALEHAEDYEKKKKKVDSYQEDICCTFKKESSWDLKTRLG